MAKKTFTFTKCPKLTGLAAVGNPDPTTDIRLNGKQVGWIDPPRALGHDDWQVWFHFSKEPTTADPAPFVNRRMKKTFATEPEAREFINALTLDPATLYGLED